MVLLTQTGQFNATTATAAITVNGLTFTTAAVIFTFDRWTSSTLVPTNVLGLGWAVSSLYSSDSTIKQGAFCIMSDDNVTVMNTGSRISNSHCIVSLSTAAPSLDSLARFLGSDATSFTLTFTNPAAIAFNISWFALGGSDITNADASTFILADSATGNITVTTGFPPDCVFQMNTNVASLDGNSASWMFNFGCAISSTKQGSISGQSQDGTTSSNTNKVSENNITSTFVNALTSTGTASKLATYVSTAAAGFTINQLTSTVTSTIILYLALKGGQYNFGAFSTATAGGNQTVVGNTFSSQGLLFFSFCEAPTTAINTYAKIGFGCVDASANTQFAAAIHDDNGIASSRCSSKLTTTSCFESIVSSTTVSAAAAFISTNTTSFTLNWTTAPATSYFMFYALFGSGSKQFEPSTGIPSATYKFIHPTPHISTKPQRNPISQHKVGFFRDQAVVTWAEFQVPLAPPTVAYEPSTSIAGIIKRFFTPKPQYRFVRNKRDPSLNVRILTFPSPTGIAAIINILNPFREKYKNYKKQNRYDAWQSIISAPPYDPSNSLASIIQRFQLFKKKPISMKEKRFDVWVPTLKFPPPTGISASIQKYQKITKKYERRKTRYDIWPPVITFPPPTGIAAVIQRYKKIVKNYGKQSTRPPQFSSWFPNLAPAPFDPSGSISAIIQRFRERPKKQILFKTKHFEIWQPTLPAPTPAAPPTGIAATINKQKKIVRNFILQSLKRTPFQQWQETLPPAPVPPAPPVPTREQPGSGAGGLRRMPYKPVKPIELIFKPKLWTRVVHRIDITTSIITPLKHEIFTRAILRSRIVPRIDQKAILRTGIILPIDRTIKRKSPIIHKIDITTTIKSRRGKVEDLIEDLEKLLGNDDEET